MTMDGASMDHLNVPYAKRWELLKDVMTRLYLEEGKKYNEIVEEMKLQYQFWATVGQYKRQFGLWNLKRALPSRTKAKISQLLETRAQQGKASTILHNGKVETRQIRRYMKEQARRDISLRTISSNGTIGVEDLSGHGLQCGNRVFMNWNLPAAVLLRMKLKPLDHVSPAFAAGSPMSGILVATPSSNAGPSPRHPSSPGHTPLQDNNQSAMLTVVQQNLKINRAHLFIQKNHKDFLRGMNLQEQASITIDWMHQFWQFSFITAKHWGRGPRTWNSTNLRFQHFSKPLVGSLPSTPAVNIGSPARYSGYVAYQSSPSQDLHVKQPSPLCRWSIHIREIEYENEQSPPLAEQLNDENNENTWPAWTEPWNINGFAESLQENLENNRFSTIPVAELPFSSSQIAKAASRSPEQLQEEAFGFSIMARNQALITNMLYEIDGILDRNDAMANFKFHELFPLHLAASYLDGAKSCCSIFNKIVDAMTTGEISVRKIYVNHLNHTVLDNLMIAILKAHTSCTPGMIDDAFKHEHQFAGEEVDICGRWDADSDCIRHLKASGSPTIPQSWKHMFCHTSIQAITHCIETLFGPHWRPDINTPSGLFLKRCPNEQCGLKLQLMPLHTLVVTTVHLAQLGKNGENLFGMVACLLCLLGKGADPSLRSQVSPTILLSGDNSQECSHAELDPLELARSVPRDFISKWPKERITGWDLFCAVLALATPPSVSVARSPKGKEKFQHIYSALIDEQVSEGDLSKTHIDTEDEMRSAGHIYEEESTGTGDEEQEEYKRYCHEFIGHGNLFSKHKHLATLWAAVQTEVLTYRRIAEGDAWISANFDMQSALQSLQNGDGEIAIGLVMGNMMNDFCGCGFMVKSDDPRCLRAEEASAHYFSNLEDWSRSTFLPYFENRDQWDDD